VIGDDEHGGALAHGGRQRGEQASDARVDVLDRPVDLGRARAEEVLVAVGA